MLKSRIISDLIKIVEETHTNKFISSEELKHPEDKYTDEFIEWYGSKDDGHAAERVVNRIVEELLKN